jgi:hypothetical protein
MNETSMAARAVDLFQSLQRTEVSLFINSNLPRPCTPAHEAGVCEQHDHSHFACGQTLADFCEVCTIKLSHSWGSLQGPWCIPHEDYIHHNSSNSGFAGIAGLLWPRTGGSS